jgi:flagellin
MSRINSNVPAFVAQANLRRANQDLQINLERLATGLKINRGKDDPAGLIVSENLRSEMASISRAIENTQRAVNIISTTEGALNEVAALLTDIQGLILQSANEGAVSDAEVRANQVQIDSAIESITRIANSTTFAGRRLLDGSLAYVTSGVDSNRIASMNITGVTFGSNSSVPVEVLVTQAAETGRLFFTQSTLASATTIEVSGKNGVVSLSLPANSSQQNILDAINLNTDATGVEAVLSAGNVVLKSTDYGSDSFVRVDVLTGGSFNTYKDAAGTTLATFDEGVDIQATINGALAVGLGLSVTLNTQALDLSIDFDASTTLSASTSFEILGGGAAFQLGPQAIANQQANIGVQSVAASRLGNNVVGFLSQIKTGEQYALPDSDSASKKQAADIVAEAIRQVAVLRGRLGAFERSTLETNINQLEITLENLTASESSIRDTDFAEETSALTRNQVLVNAATSVLALANAQPQQVLALLSG